MTAVIPPLEYRHPDCSLCGEETWHDGDSLRCDECNVYWPEPGGSGCRLDEDEAPQCTAEVKPYVDYPTAAHIHYRCLLSKGHEGSHKGGRVDDPGNEYLHEWAQS